MKPKATKMLEKNVSSPILRPRAKLRPVQPPLALAMLGIALVAGACDYQTTHEPSASARPSKAMRDRAGTAGSIARGRGIGELTFFSSIFVAFGFIPQRLVKACSGRRCRQRQGLQRRRRQR